MSKVLRPLGLALAVLCLALSATLAADTPTTAAAKKAAVPNTLSGPFTHENLTIFFVHGDDQVKGKRLLTLDEALRARKVVVHEKGSVNQLTIENLSAEDVFIQAGDIVKGGQQDRTIPSDQLIPGNSGRISISVFCVESGRWGGRGGEVSSSFSRAEHAIVGTELKLAARMASNQGEVWRNVAKAQEDLARNLKADVRAPASRSSLQLTLESPKVRESVDAYAASLQPRLDKQTDVIGYVAVINGRVVSADVYANADLFRRLWARQLRASATEALTHLASARDFVPASTATVRGFLNSAERGRSTERMGARLREVQRESDGCVLFQTRDEGGAVLRSSYLAR